MLPFVIYDSFGFFLFYFMGKNTGNILLLYTIASDNFVLHRSF